MDEMRNDAPLTGEAPQTAKPQPLRRVGSFTLGVCLIAAGIFFLLAYFVPGVDWKLMLKIAPAAGLILLGGEVLFFAARPGRWKYDFWSVLICLGSALCSWPGALAFRCCRWCGMNSARSGIRQA